MQAFGGGVSQPANGGGLGKPGKSGGLFGGGQKVGFSASKADNINPEAQDCYFYYYSTCSKGAQCKFRHCSAALGTEEVCDLWLRDQNCRRQICAFRHSVPERQRGSIPCFWESQSIGCLKPHCPFLHTKPRPQPPTVMDRLDHFKKKEFEGLKVKTLDEIREEKQLASSVTTPTFPHGARESYNLIYTPSHPPPSTSQTSFKLTSVLKTTGLAGGKKKPQIEHPTGNATTTSFLQPNAISQPITSHSAHVSKPFAVQQSTHPPPPSLKVGGVTMSVSESSKNLFTSQKNPSSFFSPIFNLTAVKKTKNELVERMGREGREGGGGRKTNISAIMWGDEEEGEGEGSEEVRKESRIIRFQPATVEPVPATKKVKLTTVSSSSSSSSSSGILSRPGPLPLPKAASSPIKLNIGVEEGGASLKVGVAVGGRSQSVGGVTDFHVKSLEEIRAGRTKGQEGREKAAITAASGGRKNGDSKTESNVMRVQPNDQQTNEKNQEGVGDVGSVVSQSHVRSKEKKIIRVKKRSSIPVEEGVGREVMGGGETQEGCEEGRGEGGEEEKESSDKESSDKEDVLTAPVTKRRKLSRTPLSIVQATPTITSSELVVTTAESQLLPNQTTKDQTKDFVPVASTTTTSKLTNTVADDEGRQEGEREERVESTHRKMSVSEMKAQIQSELRGRGFSEKVSLEQLDSELARWEEELGDVGEEGEGGASDDEGLLDSKTDDDLMLEFAEFL